MTTTATVKPSHESTQSPMPIPAGGSVSTVTSTNNPDWNEPASLSVANQRPSFLDQLMFPEFKEDDPTFSFMLNFPVVRTQFNMQLKWHFEESLPTRGPIFSCPTGDRNQLLDTGACVCRLHNTRILIAYFRREFRSPRQTLIFFLGLRQCVKLLGEPIALVLRYAPASPAFDLPHAGAHRLIAELIPYFATSCGCFPSELPLVNAIRRMRWFMARTSQFKMQNFSDIEDCRSKIDAWRDGYEKVQIEDRLSFPPPKGNLQLKAYCREYLGDVMSEVNVMIGAVTRPQSTGNIRQMETGMTHAEAGRRNTTA